jgi:hypothetical protein
MVAKRTRRVTGGERSVNRSQARPHEAPARTAGPRSPVVAAKPKTAEAPRGFGRRLRKLAAPSRKWFAGVVSAVVVGVSTPIIIAFIRPQIGSATAVQTATVGTGPLLFVAQVAPNVGDCSVTSDWITKNIAAEPPYQGGPEAVPIDGVLASGSWVGITMQAAPGKTVILESVSVLLVNRQPPTTGDLLEHGTGCGDLHPRYFALDLDAQSPTFTSRPGNTAGQNISPARFPFTVGEQDPELFLIQASAKRFAYSFRLELHWISDGQAGTTVVDDHGRPFLISSVSRAAVYCAAPDSGAWQPSTSGQCP